MAKDKLWIERDLPDSKAFRTLKRVSLIVYFDFLKKRQMEETKTSSKRSTEWIISNNGKIIYPYKQAQKKGLSAAQFRNAIDDLIDKGFLQITHQGSGGRGKDGKDGDVTTYFLDDRWKDYGTKHFQKTEKTRTRDTRQGRGWALLMNDPKKKEKILKKRKKTSLLKTTVNKAHTSVDNNRPLTKNDKKTSIKNNRPLKDENALTTYE
jgi:superoxide dismutase